jgi:hypothetical protein
VAVHSLLQNVPFGPVDIERMATAYEDAMRILQLAKGADSTSEAVAKRIIEIAQRGERDPHRLRTLAIASFGIAEERL